MNAACCILPGLTFKRSSDKRMQYYFEDYIMASLDMYNGLSQVYCIKPEGIVH